MEFLCWNLYPIPVTENHFGTTRIYVIPRYIVPHRLAIAPQQTMWTHIQSPTSTYPNEAPYWGYDLTRVTRELWLPSRLLLLVRSLMTAHSLDAIGPARHTGAETSVAKQPHIVTGHFCEAQNIDYEVTYSSAGPVYIQESNFAIPLTADVLAHHGARPLIETRMTISFCTFPSHFDWQSMILFNFIGQQKVTPKRRLDLPKSLGACYISTRWALIKYKCP